MDKTFPGITIAKQSQGFTAKNRTLTNTFYFYVTLRRKVGTGKGRFAASGRKGGEGVQGFCAHAHPCEPSRSSRHTWRNTKKLTGKIKKAKLEF